MSKITDDCSAQKEAYVVDNFEYILFYIRFGKKEGFFYLFIDSFNTFLFAVIWRQTYGKGQLR